MYIREIKFNLKVFIQDYLTYEVIGDKEACEDIIDEFREMYNDASHPLQTSIKEYLSKYDTVYDKSSLKTHLEYILSK